ncbi:MAG: cystathionine beta-lyase [Sphingobacteriales bacterium BACL12 MAG-120813-bin55]|jgi:cystathionine beta-lyase/cystathionine gamma-synthase|nr:MAG: cystathionine beta-lyase [Sphingobacteriales bacterium BACL12 MAG-120813-bin55]
MDISYIINELGEEREDYFHAVAPPIMQTSNFAFPTVDAFAEAFADELGTYIYSRARNPTVDILRKKLAALDGAEDALVFNNGAAAIAAGVMANVKAGDHIVSVKQPYTWAQRMFDVILARFGVTTTYIDGSDIAHWIEATQDNTTFYYLESPNSWNFAIQPLREVADFARSRGIVTLIDNSYCTPLFQRPIELGIDLAMQTATKYISGHSDTLGGVLSGSAPMIQRIFESEVMTVGNGIQPFNAWLLIRGLRTLPVRLERIVQTTEKVLAYILSHPRVERVLFPLHPSFPQYALASRQMKGGSGLFTMVLKADDRESIVRFCDSLRHIMMAVSWGGHESLIVPKCAGIPVGEFDALNPEHRYVRMYVGLETAEYLIADLEQAFQQM